MQSPILTFFNNKGGVGKTSLIYHLAWTYAAMGQRVVAVDLDPQANLTAAFLKEEEIEGLWEEEKPGSTVFHCVKPLTGVKDMVEPILWEITEDLFLLPGAVELSGFEDLLSEEWPNSMRETNLYRPMRILSAFWEVMQAGAAQKGGDIILVDIGPNLGAINRSALIAADYVVIPLGADLFSLQGLKNLGPSLRDWSKNWKKRITNWEGSKEAKDHPNFRLPKGEMKAIGYLCQQHGVRLSRPVRAYDRWVNRIPRMYREKVLEEQTAKDMEQATDPLCLATIKHFRSLVPMGQEHRKPIFHLTSADGAIGSHAHAVQEAKIDF